MKLPKPMIIIFAGAVIIIIGSLIAAIGTLLQNKAASEKSAIQTDKINELTDKNKDLAIQLSKTALDLSNVITGGNNVFSVTLDYVDDEKSFVKAYNSGNTPLYDNSYRMLDMDGIHQVDLDNGITKKDIDKRPNGKLYRKYEAFGEIGMIPAGTAKEVGFVKFGLKGKSRTFKIFIYSRNGVFVEDLRVAKVDGELLYNYKIYRQMEPDVIIKEFTSPGFSEDKLN